MNINYIKSPADKKYQKKSDTPYMIAFLAIEVLIFLMIVMSI